MTTPRYSEAQYRDVLHRRLGPTTPPNATKRPLEAQIIKASRDGYDSKLELSRATYLGYLVLAKDVKKFVYHPFTIHLAEKRTYSPDFLIWWANGDVQVEEIKGSIRQINARDSITRLHLAAALFPMWKWTLTMYKQGVWEEKGIP